MRPDRAYFRLWRPDLRPYRLDLRPERPDLKPEKPERFGLRPERSGLRPERPKWGERMNVQTDRLTNEQKSPCVLQDFVLFGAAAQKPRNLKFFIKKGEKIKFFIHSFDNSFI